MEAGESCKKVCRNYLNYSLARQPSPIYTHTSAEVECEAALAVERAIYGDLFPVVPNIGNRNNSAALN